jgi:14-3-3 protein epsilon
MSDKYEKNVYLAMLSEQCNRYEDMTEFLEEMVKKKTDDLNSDERNLLSIAYKNSISLRRTALRTLSAYEAKELKKGENSNYLPFIVEYKKKVENELVNLSQRIINNIDSNLIPKAVEDEAKVFYHKMKADYYRYMAENVEGPTKKQYGESSLKSYNDASESAKKLSIANPIRLGLALNFSVFYFEVMGDQKIACDIAKETLDLVKKDLNGIDEDDEEYRDAFSIVSLLQENLNMWTSENDEN